jgi:hypothetical protein
MYKRDIQPYADSYTITASSPAADEAKDAMISVFDKVIIVRVEKDKIPQTREDDGGT